MTRNRLNSGGIPVPIDEPRHRDPARAWRSSFEWQQLRRAQVARVPYCQRPGCGARSRLTADHIVPVARGGAWNDPANLQTLCLTCNSRKGAR